METGDRWEVGVVGLGANLPSCLALCVGPKEERDTEISSKDSLHLDFNHHFIIFSHFFQILRDLCDTSSPVPRKGLVSLHEVYVQSGSVQWDPGEILPHPSNGGEWGQPLLSSFPSHPLFLLSLGSS